MQRTERAHFAANEAVLSLRTHELGALFSFLAGFLLDEYGDALRKSKTAKF